MVISDADWVPGWSTEAPREGDLLLATSGPTILKPAEGWLLPWDKQAMAGRASVYLGCMGDRSIYIGEPDSPGDSSLEPVSLRDALLGMEDAPANLLNTGFQVWQWWLDHRYCGRCGHETGFHPRERARWCQQCELSWYPRLAPCVIVVIRRDDRLLLARSSRTRRNFYSLIAGFVEVAETLEEAVAREVKEETGLDVTNIRYQGSQPWPFPHQLMMGFFADYAGGELVLQEDEIADAGWFLPGDTPPVPPQGTIAGRLIRAMEKEISRGGIPL